ncbi:MAG: DUF2878 domain-containing protein [Gammaproteobacteria bacterium]|nr:DUF2878 domain-containing protein [Gammaproteobacteria bacterium]
MQAMIINFLAFQAGWFAWCPGGASGWPWLGVGVVAVVIALHVFQSPEASRELRLVAAAAVIGTAWDSTLAATGLLIYPSGQLASMLAPVWIVALWMGFATCLNVSLRWLKGRRALAMLLGGVAGPLSFWAGSRLGAVRFARSAAVAGRALGGLGAAHAAAAVGGGPLGRLGGTDPGPALTLQQGPSIR